MNRNQLAVAAGIPPASLWQWENLDVIPMPAAVIKLARVLSVERDGADHLERYEQQWWRRLYDSLSEFFPNPQPP